MPVEAASESFGVRSERFKTSKKQVRYEENYLINRFGFYSFRYEGVKIYLYTGDLDATPKQIISKCRNNFNIQIDTDRLEFIFLKQRKWVEAERYPVLTLLGQSLGSIVLGFEALLKFQPDIYLDTMGKCLQII